MGVIENQLSYLLCILCCVKHEGELSRGKVQIPQLTAAAHLPDCFTCCRVILFIVHVGKVSSTWQSFQKFSFLCPHLAQKTLCPYGAEIKERILKVVPLHTRTPGWRKRDKHESSIILLIRKQLLAWWHHKAAVRLLEIITSDTLEPTPNPLSG